MRWLVRPIAGLVWQCATDSLGARDGLGYLAGARDGWGYLAGARTTALITPGAFA